MDPKRRRYYIITGSVFLAIFLFAAAITVYTDQSYVKIEVEGTPHAYFFVTYDSTNVTVPVSQNTTVVVLPHVNVTIIGHPDPAYVLSRWTTRGGQVLRTGNDSISIMTGGGGETIAVSAVLLATPSA
jgi:hypothetical protein